MIDWLTNFGPVNIGKSFRIFLIRPCAKHRLLWEGKHQSRRSPIKNRPVGACRVLRQKLDGGAPVKGPRHMHDNAVPLQDYFENKSLLSQRVQGAGLVRTGLHRSRKKHPFIFKACPWSNRCVRGTRPRSSTPPRNSARTRFAVCSLNFDLWTLNFEFWSLIFARWSAFTLCSSSATVRLMPECRTGSSRTPGDRYEEWRS